MAYTIHITATYCRRVSYIRRDVLWSTCICSDNICYRTNVHVYIHMCVHVQVIRMCVWVHCTRDLYTAYACSVQVPCDLYTAYASAVQVVLCKYHVTCTRHTQVLCKLLVTCTRHTHVLCKLHGIRMYCASYMCNALIRTYTRYTHVLHHLAPLPFQAHGLPPRKRDWLPRCHLQAIYIDR